MSQTVQSDSLSLAEILTLSNRLSRDLPDIDNVAVYTSQRAFSSEVLEYCCTHAVDIVENITSAMGITIERVDNTRTHPT